MRKLILGFMLVVFFTGAAFANSPAGLKAKPKDSVSTFMMIQNYHHFVRKAEANLETLYMHSLIELNPKGQPLYLYAWKACMNHQQHPTLADPKYGGVFNAVSSARNDLRQSAKNLQDIMRDGFIKFSDEKAKSLFLEAIELINKANSNI